MRVHVLDVGGGGGFWVHVGLARLVGFVETEESGGLGRVPGAEGFLAPEEGDVLEPRCEVRGAAGPVVGPGHAFAFEGAG